MNANQATTPRVNDVAGAEAPPATRDDPVSLEILVKALAASVAALVTAPLGPEAAVVSAVVATFVADGVREVARRRGWGRKRLTALTGLVLLFSRVDAAFSSHKREAGAQASRAARSACTSVAAVAIAVLAVSTTEMALGKSLTADRSLTFLGGSSSEQTATAVARDRTEHPRNSRGR